MDREIDELLRADAFTAEQTKRLFDWFDPSLRDSFDRAARMFTWFGADATTGEREGSLTLPGSYLLQDLRCMPRPLPRLLVSRTRLAAWTN